MQYAQSLAPSKESSALLSETVSHSRTLGFSAFKVLLTLNVLVLLSLAMLLVLGWFMLTWAQAILNLLFILGLAG
jgi:hypothetical protein